MKYEVAEAGTKASGALGYKLELPSGIKVTHTLWESGNAEVFLKHVMAAVSYVAKKGYIKEYEVAKREAVLAVFDCRIAKDLWMAAHVPEAGAVTPELMAFQEAKLKVNDKTLSVQRLQE